MSAARTIVGITIVAVVGGWWLLRSDTSSSPMDGSGSEIRQAGEEPRSDTSSGATSHSPNRFFEKSVGRKLAPKSASQPAPITWVRSYEGGDSWFSEQRASEKSQPTSVTHKGRTVTVVTDRHVNTNGILNYLESEAQLELETSRRAGVFSNLLQTAHTSMSKADVIKLMGSEPAKAAQNERFDYLAFSTHPNGKLPGGTVENWPLAFVFFDRQGRYERWNLVLQR